MFIEKRECGKSIKYYLVHSYRDRNNVVRKIRRFLGTNLSIKQIEKLSKRAEEIIKAQIEEQKTDLFEFSLSDKKIRQLNKFNENIEIRHLSRREWKIFTEDFVYNTNAIEGSTIQKDEIQNVLEQAKTKDPEEMETKGVAEAVDLIRNFKEDLSLNLIKKIHKLCFKGSKDFAGKFRNVDVVIKDSRGNILHRGTSRYELKEALNEYVFWYHKNKNKFKPLILAAIVHNQFEHIHPFQDGNGRVGRLLLNFILLKNKYPPINILLEDRMEYYNTLQIYHKEHNLKPALKFLIKQYDKTLKKVTTIRKSE